MIISLIALLVGSNVANLTQSANAGDGVKLGTAKVSVYVDGKLVASAQDNIAGTVYDYLVCKIWNESTACSNTQQIYSTFINGNPNAGANTCQAYYTTSNAYHSVFQGKTLCNAMGIALSNDSTTIPSGGSGSILDCPHVISNYGLSPVKASATHTGLSNTVTLTASWTASHAAGSIYKACLFPYSDKSGSTGVIMGTYSVSGNPIALAVDLLPSSPISVSNAQALSVQWTFSF